MAAATKLLLLLFSLVFLFTCSAIFATNEKRFPVEAIYNFGDSISDTRNLLWLGDLGPFAVYTSLPYGQTYFHRPTGRCSDGLLMVDVIAMELGLPLLNPYLERDAHFRHGVNFAVAGATAINNSFWMDQGFKILFKTNSLDIQLDWFKAHLSSRCSSKTECARMFKKALFLLGEIGGNDYNYGLLQGKSVEELTKYLPSVVQAIKDAARRLIGTRAIYLVIPGNFPVGCSPMYLTSFHSNDPASYDENKCLKHLNEFAMLQNDRLQEAIKELREEFPHVSIAYADYYNALLGIITHPEAKGFEKDSTIKACCGSGGDYNVDMMKTCGAPEVPVCSNPERYISWYGAHLTQGAHEHMELELFSRIAREWGWDA